MKDFSDTKTVEGTIEGDMIHVAAWAAPFKAATATKKVWEGLTVQEIADMCDIPPERMPYMRARLGRGDKTSVVPSGMWDKVKPRNGSVLEFYCEVNGKAVALILSIIVAVVAPVLAPFVLGALGVTATAFAIALAATAITVVGQLLISALIPPPSANKGASSDAATFTITGASNVRNPYGVYPTVLGRHLMFPPMTAQGYSETVDDEIYWRARYTFGYGPVSLETLKIGTTDIMSFSDVQIEFLNVDQTLTTANIPALSGAPNVSWKTGSTAMTLYASTIEEDPYSVALAVSVGSTRTTRTGCITAQVDIGFQGLCDFDTKGNKVAVNVNIDIRYRLAGSGGAFIFVATKLCTGRTTSYVRFTQEINFPSAAQWEISVTRTTALGSSVNIREAAVLSAIRSIKTGGIPSNPNIAEVAIRVKATEQLNGQIDTLNAIVQQLGRVWDGTTWSAPQPIRHPAWIYAACVQGPQMGINALPDARVDLAGLLAWATNDPTWTCDTVVDQTQPLSQVLDMVAATGRARRSMNDLKFGVIRDNGANSIVQHFTPRNTFGFKGSRVISREIHAFRVRVISEQKDWQQDEVLVYADGYSASNATMIETLDLPAVILSKFSTTQGNAWRLGRYHLAQAILRPEEYTFSSDLDHVRCQMGDIVRLVHDVPLFSVGSARIKDISYVAGILYSLQLDDWANLEDAKNYRARVRLQDGTTALFDTRHGTQGACRHYSATFPQSGGLNIGDLIMIDLTSSTPVDLLVKSIRHSGDLIAEITCVDAAPAVLTADSGTIPAYSPNVTPLTRFGPTLPTVIGTITGSDAAILSGSGSAVARIGINVSPPPTVGPQQAQLQARWREVGTTPFKVGPPVPNNGTVFTGELVDGVSYETHVRGLGKDGKSRGWVSAGTVTAAAVAVLPAAPTGWTAAPFFDTINFDGPATFYYNFLEYRLYASTAGSTTETLVARSASPHIVYSPPTASAWTRYKIAVALNTGAEGTHSAYIAAVVSGVGGGGIGAGTITNAMLTSVNSATFKARLTAGAGAPEDLTVSQAKALLAITTADITGLLLASQVPTFTGDVTGSAGSLALTISAGAVTLAKQANLAALSVIGNDTGSATTPAALSVAQLMVMLTASQALGRPWLTPVSGDDLPTSLTSLSTGTATGVADRMFLFPFCAPAAISFSALKANISTGGAGNIKLGYYASDAQGRPTTLIGETAAISSVTAGMVSGSLSGSLVAGSTYWFFMRISGTASFSTWNAGATPSLNVGPAATTSRSTLLRSVTFASGAPNPWVYTNTEINTGNAPAVWMTQA